MSRRHICRGRSRTGIARCTAGRIWRSVLPKSRQHQRERLLKSLGNGLWQTLRLDGDRRGRR